ncbi:MAG TPA: D-galactonate dehydratase family protein [Anaerolineae bacterium]|nr:D-galactonate dehydratase family protein [Anaerolineae bacterium]
MKITRVKPLLTCPQRNYIFVKIETDEGVYGWGEASLNWSEYEVMTRLEQLAPLLIGQDPTRIEDLWHFLYARTYWHGGPINMAALAGIDMALWDILGKRAGLPLYQLLGGKSREGVLVYNHAIADSFEETAEQVQGYIEQGYKVVRAQVGEYGGVGNKTESYAGERADATEYVERTDYFNAALYMENVPKLFEYLRGRFGMELELFHDVHGKLTPIDAIRLAKNLEPYRLLFLEDPLRPEHRESFRLLRQHTITPLGVGEIMSSKFDLLPLFQEQLIDFYRLPPIHGGGITEARKIAALAEPYQIRSAFHGPDDIGPIAQAASVHISRAIHNFGVLEWANFNALTHEVVSGICSFRDGLAYPQELPGLGVDVNENIAAQFPYQRVPTPVARLADGTMHVY